MKSHFQFNFLKEYQKTYSTIEYFHFSVLSVFLNAVIIIIITVFLRMKNNFVKVFNFLYHATQTVKLKIKKFFANTNEANTSTQTNLLLVDQSTQTTNETSDKSVQVIHFVEEKTTQCVFEKSTTSTQTKIVISNDKSIQARPKFSKSLVQTDPTFNSSKKFLEKQIERTICILSKNNYSIIIPSGLISILRDIQLRDMIEMLKLDQKNRHKVAERYKTLWKITYKSCWIKNFHVCNNMKQLIIICNNEVLIIKMRNSL